MIAIGIAAVIVVFACGFVSMFSASPRPAGETYSYQIASPSQATLTPMLTATADFARGYNQGSEESDQTTQTTQGSVTQQAQAPEQPRRIVIRNATINITVEDTQARVNEISAMAVEFGGWVVSSSTRVSGGTTERPNVYGNITIRVPAESLDTALTRIRAMATVINNEQIIGQDVTQDYVDAQSRLRNLESAEEQLQTIMDTATNVEEVMTVYNQLVDTRSEIEVLRGRLQYWDQASAFSAITVTLNPVAAPPPQPVQLGWNPTVTVMRGIESLVRFTQGIVDVLITLAIVGLPLALIFGVPALLLWRQMRRRPLKREALASKPPTLSS
jgi:hypothetical protein